MNGALSLVSVGEIVSHISTGAIVPQGADKRKQMATVWRTINYNHIISLCLLNNEDPVNTLKLGTHGSKIVRSRDWSNSVRLAFV